MHQLLDDATVVSVLRAPDDDPRLPLVVGLLYDRWTRIALADFKTMTPGARETAFAVTIEQLARETRWKTRPLQADKLRGRERDVIIETLARRQDVERQRRRPNALWLWEDARTEEGALRLVSILVQCSRGARDAGADDALAGLYRTIVARAERSQFKVLESAAIHDATTQAILRLLSPLTAAALTTANLARRVRDIAVQELTKEERKLRNVARDPDLGDLIDSIPDPNGDYQKSQDKARTQRVQDIILDTIRQWRSRAADWLSGEKTATERAKKEKITPSAMSRWQTRHEGFARDSSREIENEEHSKQTLGPLRERLNKLREKYYIDPELFDEIWNAIAAAFASGLLALQALVPGRIREILRRLRGGNSGDGAGSSNA